MVVPLAKARWIVALSKVSLVLLTLVIVGDFFRPVLSSRAVGIDARSLKAYRLRRHVFLDEPPPVNENVKQYIFQASDDGSNSSSINPTPSPEQNSSSPESFAAASQLHVTPLITETVPRPIDIESTSKVMNDEEMLTLVTKPSSSQSPFTTYTHSSPYDGTMYHVSSSIHPSKDLRKNNFQLSALWFIEQEGFTDWMSRDVQARMPPSVDFLNFACIYTKPDGTVEEVEATVSKQARNEYLLLECALPTWIRKQLDLSSPTTDRVSAFSHFGNTTVSLESRFDPGDCASLRSQSDSPSSPHLSWRDEHCQSARSIGSATYIPGPVHTIVPTDWSSTAANTPLSVCVSPVRLQATTGDGQVPLKHLVEWRVWHMYQGVGRVHWYSRDPQFRSWIDQLNTLLNVQDTYLDAPALSNQFPENGKNYADQAVYAADCLMRYGFEDKYQAYIDLDEFLTVRQDPSRNATWNRLDRLPEDIGSIAADHTYYGGDQIDTDLLSHSYQSETFPPNSWTHWDTLEKHDGFRRQKSIHRTGATKMLWVHSSAGLGSYYFTMQEVPPSDLGQNDIPGLEIIHNRNPKPNKLTFDIPVNYTNLDNWEEAWDEMAGILGSQKLLELHTFDPNQSMEGYQ